PPGPAGGAAGARLEKPRGDAAALLTHLHRHALKRAPPEGDAAAAEGAEALGPRARVAVDHLHVVGGDAEMVGHDLGEGRFVPLPVRARARDGGDLAGALHLDAAALPSERTRPDV